MSDLDLFVEEWSGHFFCVCGFLGFLGWAHFCQPNIPTVTYMNDLGQQYLAGIPSFHVFLTNRRVLLGEYER